ncbi:MAG: N-6 DNA methylase [Anaerolineae bacterium]
MPPRRSHQKLPNAGPEREALREKGQFWTPNWVAEAMVAYVTSGGGHSIFDPAVGEGAFFRAAKSLSQETGRGIGLLGTEIDHEALQQARANGLSDADLAKVQITDFVLRPPAGPYPAIVANPPYIRHHRIPPDVKATLQRYGASITGTALDGRAGLHVYFLLRALQLLDREGRLAFIMPADTCEGVFAGRLWEWIARHYRLDAVITFSPDASPFPGVDTNPVVFMITNSAPTERFIWAKCNRPDPDSLKQWALSVFTDRPPGDLTVCDRLLTEALATGLSRPPGQAPSDGPVLGDYARVMRGIATGANEYFFLTVEQAKALHIPDEFLIAAIGRTRDVDGDEITQETLAALERQGRPTRLLALDGRPVPEFPQPVQAYLRQGEAMGIHQRTLIATRRPWYKMEERKAPPFLFAYLGRRNARFVHNRIGAVPLTGFLCVYPRSEDTAFVDGLWHILQHPATVANLSLVGKSYGGGAIKVEPRALERLRIPDQALAEARPVSVEEEVQLLLGI